MKKFPTFPKLPPLDDLLKRVRKNDDTPKVVQTEKPSSIWTAPAYLTPDPFPVAQYTLITCDPGSDKYVRWLNPDARVVQLAYPYREIPYPQKLFDFSEPRVRIEIDNFETVVGTPIKAASCYNKNAQLIVFAWDRLIHGISLEFGKYMSDYPYKQFVGLQLGKTWDDLDKSCPEHIKQIVRPPQSLPPLPISFPHQFRDIK